MKQSVAAKQVRIPKELVLEFMNNPIIKEPNGKNGTKMADLLIMKKVITETMSSPEFLERVANYVMQRSQLTMR